MDKKDIQEARSLTHLHDEYLIRRLRELQLGLPKLARGATWSAHESDLVSMEGSLEDFFRHYHHWKTTSEVNAIFETKVSPVEV